MKTKGCGWKKQGRRLLVSLAAGLIAAQIPWSGELPEAERRPPEYSVGAWWGWLYPEYCFSGKQRDEEGKEQEKHFSFWVAKALDWW